ncbi:hypothetical protein AK973_3816 [Pseudomonas brassicacearum]|nr:hypothetical protein AK973_3816 [Pseudomonas brassicacearum]
MKMMQSPRKPRSLHREQALLPQCGATFLYIPSPHQGSHTRIRLFPHQFFQPCRTRPT